MPLSWILGTLTSWNPMGHSRSVTGLLLLCVCSEVIYVSLIVLQRAVHLQPSWRHVRSKNPPDFFVVEVGFSGFSLHISSPQQHNDNASEAPCPFAVRWQADVDRLNRVVANTRRLTNPKCHVTLNVRWYSSAATLLRWLELQNPNIFLHLLYQRFNNSSISN